MKRLVLSSRYKRDARRLKKQGKRLDRLDAVLELLMAGTPLPPYYKDHALKGEWAGFRELHVESDWLLIYINMSDSIYLDRSGSHTELFNM